MPKVDTRFWIALCFASVCGINLGDLLPDNLHPGPLPALAVLIAVLAGLALAHRLVNRRAELLFWLAVIAVKAAATIAADFTVQDAHMGFPAVVAVSAILLLACVAATGGFVRSEESPKAGLTFWPLLLICGTLGTAAADWSGISLLSSPKIGFPATAAIETLLIAAGFLARRAAGGRAWGFWLLVLIICAWGASVGDIAKFLLSMPVSLGGSAILLALTIFAWPSPRAATRT